jgi:hypothetical protein
MSSWLETLILGVVLLLCLIYVYKSTKSVFTPKKPGQGCGGCKPGSSSCIPPPTEDADAQSRTLS